MSETKPENVKRGTKMLESGHPLNILMLENEALKQRLAAIRGMIGAKVDPLALKEPLQDLSQAGRHYDKKEELIISSLKRHSEDQMLDSMWNADGELRRSLRILLMTADAEEPSAFRTYVNDLLQRMEEMVSQEETILYPQAEATLSDSEWQSIYLDYPMFGYAWLDEIPVWKNAQKKAEDHLYATWENGSEEDAKVHLPGGTLTLRQLEGILRTLPMELTFIDEDEINQYFSENSKLIPRPLSALGEEVYNCHPQRVRDIVKSVIEKLKSGEQDMISFPTEKRGKKVMIQYLAVRAKNGRYLGLLETVQELNEPRIR